MSRARSVEIYLKDGIEEDDQVYQIWASLRGRARPQDVFRRALRLGLQGMAESGELPRTALEVMACHPPTTGRPLAKPARMPRRRGVLPATLGQQETAQEGRTAQPGQAEPVTAREQGIGHADAKDAPTVMPPAQTMVSTPPARVPSKPRLGRLM